MTVNLNAGDCQVVYGFKEAHFRALKSDGSADTDADWVATDCPISIGIDPEVEEGARSNLKCGDGIRNTMLEDDQLVGMTITFAMGCRNPEIEKIIGGSVGTVAYDASSPPIAIGYEQPSLDEQKDAVGFECRFYQKEIDGSDAVGYSEMHVYQCKPAYVKYGGNQEEYATQEWTIKATENPSYDATGKPVYGWKVLTTIPT